jgi:hypothetical protein
MKVQFICKVSAAEVAWTPPKAKISESKIKIQNPATIISISRGGMVDVRFYMPVLVPNYTIQ